MSIPQRYHDGMSTQIAVRLPDETVAYLDDLVRSGAVESRAAAVKIALERDRRRRRSEADIAIVLADQDDGLDGLTSHGIPPSLSELD